MSHVSAIDVKMGLSQVAETIQVTASALLLDTVSTALSNVIQISYFKLSGGKRVFKRAPLHHHFEEIGWAETQIVTRAWVVGFAAAILGVALALAVPD